MVVLKESLSILLGVGARRILIGGLEILILISDADSGILRASKWLFVVPPG